MAKKAKSKISKAVQAALNVADEKQGFKVDMKYVKTSAHAVVKMARDHGKTMRDKITEWKGERPETLDAMKKQVEAECKAWLKDEGKNVVAQVVYNIQSELIGCLNGYIVYAGMTDAKRAAFDKKHAEATSYVRLVKFLRDTKRGKQNRVVDPAGKRLLSLHKNHKKEYQAKLKDMIRYAGTDTILMAIDFAEALIEARKKGNVLRMDAFAKAEEAKKKAA